MKQKLKGAVIGAGYFSQFHYRAWQRIPGVEIVALAEMDLAKGEERSKQFSVSKVYGDFREMLEKEKPDFVDIVTPPVTHEEIVAFTAGLKIPMICQKPLAPTFSVAESMVKAVSHLGVPFMVHENYRFQPWHREVKKLLENGEMGNVLLNLSFRMRMGDGWQEDAYMQRQPYFRTMPRLLIFETGIHFIDTFRFLAGEVSQVYARMKKLNQQIAGEDFAQVLFDFTSGATGLFDGSRYHESNFHNPRLTFGEMLVECDKGSIRLYNDGHLTVQKLGGSEKVHPYHFEDRDFAGDCVYFTQKHFVECLIGQKEFETNGKDYLKNLLIQDAVYKSAETGMPMVLK